MGCPGAGKAPAAFGAAPRDHRMVQQHPPVARAWGARVAPWGARVALWGHRYPHT